MTEAAAAQTPDSEIFEFLDTLRMSGQINMFGAPAVIREAFDLDKDESFKVFERWTKTFDEA